MLSGLEHEVRSQLNNTEPKHNIFLNDWMEPDSLREGYFLKSCWVFYWWYFHIHTHAVNGLVSIWFIVSFTRDRRAILRSALADLAEISARGDHNVPSCTWKSLRWIPGKIEFMFLLPVFFSEQVGRNAQRALSTGHGLFCLLWAQGLCWVFPVPDSLWQGWANEILNWLCEELSSLLQVGCCKRSCF